jgi:tripartite-type tricarboxylate transporter receptor subunit TctC
MHKSERKRGLLARRSVVKGLGAVAGSLALGLSSARASLLGRKVTILVPFSAGGSVDVSARALARALEASVGTPVIVENRPGAAGQVAYEAGAAANADGSTLTFASGTLAMLHHTNPSFSLDYRKAFAPVALVHNPRPIGFVVSAKVPVTSMAEFIDYAKQNPGKLNHAAVGATAELMNAWLKHLAQIETQDIRYPGSAQAIVAMLNGEADYHMTHPVTVADHVKGGKLRLLATTGTERWAPYPDVPAVKETVPDFVYTFWNGLIAPTGTPAETIATLHAAVRKSVENPVVVSLLKEQGAVPASAPPEELGRLLASEQELYDRILKETGFKFQ